MDLETLSILEYMWEQEDHYKKSLTQEELLYYNKSLALLKLKPFLKKWIYKHFGEIYMHHKYAMMKKYREDLDFYYAMIEE
jgi:hypothetical protein